MQEDWTKYKVQPQEDFSEYIVKKKELAVESNLVSTPDQEFLTGEAEKRRSYDAFVAKAKERGKEAEQAVSEKANQAKQPVSFINEANYANRRLEAIRRNVPQFIEEARALHEQLQTATPENIEEINTAIDRLEGWIKPVQTRTMESQDPREYRTWSNYRDEAKSDSYFAVKNLQEDNEKLKKAASFSKGAEEAVKTANEQFSDEDLKRFIEFDKNPRRLQGATESEREKYTSYRGMIGSGKTVEDVEDARKALMTGVGVGVKDYVEGYTKLTDELRGNIAVTELMDKINKVEQGEDVEFTSDDNLLMKALVDNAQLHEELDSEIPQAYKIGESLGTSIGFMAEFLATGGVAQAVGKQALKAAAKTGAKKAIGKLGVGTAVKLAQAGVQTAAMPSFYKKTAENVSNGMNFGEASLDAFWETGVENLSERVFMTSPVKGLSGRGVEGLLRRAGINFNIDKGAVGVFKNTLEEAAEEKIGEIMTAPKDYDSFKDFWKGFTDVEQNITMLGSVGLMTGGMGSVALSGNTLAETRRKARVKRIEKFVPSDLRAEIDIITGNTDLTLEQQYGLIGDAISSRIDSQELGEDPATTTGNAMQYAQYKIQEQASQTTDENAVVENGELTVGEVEAVGNMQEQADYLTERGVDVNVLNGEQVQKLYDKTKAEEDRAAMDEATPPTEEEMAEAAEKPTTAKEKPSQKEEIIATEPTLPKNISEMSGEELRSFADDIKRYEEDVYDMVFGEDVARVRELEKASNSIDINRAKKANSELDTIINSLSEEKQDLWDSELQYNRQDIIDIARDVEAVESSDNATELAVSIKKSLLKFVSNNNDKTALAVFGAASRRAVELNVPTEDVIRQSINLIGRDIRDKGDAELIIKSVLSSILNGSSYEAKYKAIDGQSRIDDKLSVKNMVLDMAKSKNIDLLKFLDRQGIIKRKC